MLGIGSLIFLGMMLYVYMLLFHYELWNEPINYRKPEYPPEPDYYTERKRRMESLMKWQLYKSDRFILTGSIMYRVVITDLHEDAAYEILCSEMVKFRKHWEKLELKNKDAFLIAFTVTKSGKAIKKVA